MSQYETDSNSQLSSKSLDETMAQMDMDDEIAELEDEVLRLTALRDSLKQALDDALTALQIKMEMSGETKYPLG